MKKILPFLFILLACNNSADKNETKKDTAQSGHDHPTVSSGEIPALPAIPDGAQVFFENLKEGQTVTSPFKVRMATEKIMVDTAGPVKAGSGHHHILINRGAMTSGETIPMDTLHLHFGRGQKEAEIKLQPGRYQLTMQFADGLHRSYGEKLSSSVNILVKE